MKVNAVHSKITDQIVQAIEEGTGEFEIPWHGQSGFPANPVTSKNYHGINTLSLWVSNSIQYFTVSAPVLSETSL